jgi:superfamily II DNA/RNA helicase
MLLAKVQPMALSDKKRAHQSKFQLLNPASTAQNLVEQDFSSMQLHSTLIDALKAQFQITSPTPIQQCLLPRALNSYKDLVFASETGGGKTLAYLLPVFHQLKREEEELTKEVPLPESVRHSIEAITADGLVVSNDSGLAQIRKLGRPR